MAKKPSTEIGPLTRKKRDKPLTSRAPGRQRRVPPEDVDPDFLTDGELYRREAFAQAYLAKGNASEAARTAGYTGTHVRGTASRLLKEPAVQKRIMELRTDLLQELGITQRAILAEYARIAFFDLRQCFDEHGNLLSMEKMPPDAARVLAVYEVETRTFGAGDDAMDIVNKKIKTHSKMDALDKLRSHVGLATPAEKATVDATTFLQMLLAGRERALQPAQARFEKPDKNGRTIEHSE